MCLCLCMCVCMCLCMCLRMSLNTYHSLFFGGLFFFGALRAQKIACVCLWKRVSEHVSFSVFWRFFCLGALRVQTIVCECLWRRVSLRWFCIFEVLFEVLRVEFLLRTESGYLRDAEVTFFPNSHTAKCFVWHVFYNRAVASLSVALHFVVIALHLMKRALYSVKRALHCLKSHPVCLPRPSHAAKINVSENISTFHEKSPIFSEKRPTFSEVPPFLPPTPLSMQQKWIFQEIWCGVAAKLKKSTSWYADMQWCSRPVSGVLYDSVGVSTPT